MVEIRADILADDHGAPRIFQNVGDKAAFAAKTTRLFAESLEKERRAAGASAGATLALAKAQRVLADEEEYATKKTVEEVIALDQQKRAAKEAAEGQGRLQ